jgi:hypothetical protein
MVKETGENRWTPIYRSSQNSLRVHSVVLYQASSSLKVSSAYGAGPHELALCHQLALITVHISQQAGEPCAIAL